MGDNNRNNADNENSKDDEFSHLLGTSASEPALKTVPSGNFMKVPSNSLAKSVTTRNIRTQASKGRRNAPGTLNVLAAQTLKIASINGLGELDKLENDLEDELRYENRSPAITKIGRLRREGQHKLHSKFVLLIIVLLNIIDCLLVMAELTLDFHHVSHLLEEKRRMLRSFSSNMEEKYDPVLENIGKEKTHVLLQKILDAQVVFNTSGIPANVTLFASECSHFLNKTAEGYNQSLTDFISSNRLLSSDWSEPSSCFQPFVNSHPNSLHGNSSTMRTYHLSSNGQVDSTLTTVAHKLHYISISILSVLVVVLLLKIFCSGKRFFKSRMQVFDGVIILISFTLDLVFIEGITILDMANFVIILTFLLPWRILRVLNSLIVAVLDKQRLNLKILYTQKKKISRSLSETNSKLDVMQRHIQVLQNLCQSRGVGDHEVRKVLGKENGGSSKHSSNGGLASMMALGKLAFQAADAFAPITNGYKKTSVNSTGSAPVLHSGENSVVTTPIRETNSDLPIDNNNHTNLPQETAVDLQNSGSEGDFDNVTIQINGSGPPKEAESPTKREKKISVSLPDLTEEHYENDTVVSKL